MQPGHDCDSSICERCFGGLCSFQTGFYINCMAEASPNLPSVGSLSPSLSPPLLPIFSPSLFSCLSFLFFPLYSITNTTQKTHSHSHTVYKTRAFCWLEQRAQLRQVVTFFLFFLFFFLPSICYQRSLGILQSLVRGPAFFAISRMI